MHYARKNVPEYDATCLAIIEEVRARPYEEARVGLAKNGDLCVCTDANNVDAEHMVVQVTATLPRVPRYEYSGWCSEPVRHRYEVIAHLANRQRDDVIDGVLPELRAQRAALEGTR